ncbi:MAG: hypothetical protein PHW03_04620 [Eubacteriales bacterium]|nr:hypothetical protein [Eubacteriales bacterium]
MRESGMSRSHLFLIELIIATLFFAFACAVNVQVFIKAHDFSKHSTTLNNAILAIQSAAETDKTAAFSETMGQQRTMYFDAKWQGTDSKDADYRMMIDTEFETREAGTMVIRTYNIMPKTTNEIIYSLISKKYYAGHSLDELPDNVVEESE